MDFVEVHYHEFGTPRPWACGAQFGQATGDITQVTCPACAEVMPKPEQPKVQDGNAEVLQVPAPEVSKEGPREFLVGEMGVPAVRTD